MKILVLGAGGMLGHLAGIYFKNKYGSRVVLTARRKTGHRSMDEGLEVFDLLDRNRLEAFIGEHRSCVVVNCAAVNDPAQGEELLHAVNTQLPHTIAEILDSKQDDSRLIHISTDGVFSGKRGNYSEQDPVDAPDPYGQSKLKGEIVRPPHLTVRTSLVGPDPFHGRGLMSWFLSQRESVQGYDRVYWSGVTTLALAQFIDQAITGKYSGLYHLSSQKISKYELLEIFQEVFKTKIKIVRAQEPVLDRSLVSKRKDIRNPLPAIRQMIEQIRAWMLERPDIYRREGVHFGAQNS